jgi:predicted methyltransferase
VSTRARLAIFALGAGLFLFVLDTAYEGLKTLRRLDIIEAERDQWQRPAEILSELNLQPGDTVVDLGCGSGYFTLKIAPAVNPGGTVYAVDIRRLSLTFLWIRTLTKDLDNVRTVVGRSDDPRVPAGTADAVLIANTYHELAAPDTIVDRVFQALVPSGRLVVVEPMRTERGENSPAVVQEALLRHGFEIVGRDDKFIDPPTVGQW